MSLILVISTVEVEEGKMELEVRDEVELVLVVSTVEMDVRLLQLDAEEAPYMVVVMTGEKQCSSSR